MCQLSIIDFPSFHCVCSVIMEPNPTNIYSLLDGTMLDFLEGSGKKMKKRISFLVLAYSSHKALAVHTVFSCSAQQPKHMALTTGNFTWHSIRHPYCGMPKSGHLTMNSFPQNPWSSFPPVLPPKHLLLNSLPWTQREVSLVRQLHLTSFPQDSLRMLPYWVPLCAPSG